MKLLLPLAASAFILAGCGAGEGGKQETPLLQFGIKRVTAPDFKGESDIWLIGDHGRIQVGTTLDVASKVFPKPDSNRAVAFRDLPPGFGPGFRSEGWETDAEGFGIISLEGQLVSAVRTETGVGEERVGQALRKYQVGLSRSLAQDLNLEQPTKANSWARYWFLQDEKARLMICAVRLKGGVLNITEAVGTPEAMDAMRMSEKAAKNDLERLSVQRASAGAKPN